MQQLKRGIVNYEMRWLEKAAKLEKLGRWSDFLAFGREWADAEPKNFLAWQVIGDALSQLNMFEEAIASYRKGLEVAPTVPVEIFGARLSAGALWYRLGNAYSAQKNFSSAIDAFQAAGRIDPEISVVWNNLGIAYLDMGMGKESEEAFQKALAIAPKDLKILGNLGHLYARGGIDLGVADVHKRLAKISRSAAREFLKNAQEILSRRPR